MLTYPVNFTESGLPASTSWTVTLNGTPADSTSTVISFVEPNGSYPFTVGSVTGYSTSQSSGTVHVVGHPADQFIEFTAKLRALTVTLSIDPDKIPVGNSTTISANPVGGTLPFSYVYTGLPPGCTTQNSSSWQCTPTATANYTIKVVVTDGQGATVNATAWLLVTAVSIGTNPANNGSNYGLEWTILGAAVALIAVLILVMAWRRRQKPPPSVAPKPATPPAEPPAP